MRASIKTKLLVVCSLLVLFITVGVSIAYYGLAKQDKHRESQQRIQIAFEIILDDLARQMQFYTQRFEEQLQRDNTFRVAADFYIRRQQSLQHVTGMYPFLVSRLSRLGELIEVDQLSLFTIDGELLAAYQHPGVHTLSQSQMEQAQHIASDMTSPPERFPVGNHIPEKITANLFSVVRAVDGVSMAIKPGETLGVVGESGCGKSVTAFSIMRLLPKKTSRIAGGTIHFDRGDGKAPVDLTTVDPNGNLIRSIRGNEIAMIFQEPLTSLSPVHTVGSQIAEAVKLHQNADDAGAYKRTIEMLQAVGIAMPEQRYTEYPHQFSGGMRQRAMIAMALPCNPSLLIADEPTTALDVTIQAQILELMKSLQKDFGTAIMIITHDLVEYSTDHYAACHRVKELTLTGISD